MSFYDIIAAQARNGEGPGMGNGWGNLLELGQSLAKGEDPKRAIGGAGGAVAGGAIGTKFGGPTGGKIGSAVGGALGKAALGGKKKAGPRFDIPMMEPTEQIDPGFLTALMQGGMPGYGLGTMFQPGGMAMVGENGPELAPLQPGPVLPIEMLLAAAQGGQEMPEMRGGMGPMDFSGQVGDYAEEVAPQMGQRDGFMADIARALGSNPFSDEGSLGGLMEQITGALPGRDHRGARIAGAGLGALGNILTNRELTAQSDVDKLNESLRTRAATRNEDLRKRSAEDRKNQSEIAKEKRTAAATKEADAAKRRFILSDKVAGKLGLPSGERVTFDEYTKALDAAKDKLPTNEFDRVLSASPAEWKTYVSRKGELTKAEAKPAAVEKGKPPSAGEREQLASDIATISQTGNIRGLLKPEFVGPYAGPTGNMALKTGKGLKPGYAKFRAALAKYNNAAFKVLAGTAGGKAEADRVLKELASENDPYEVFVDKLAETEKAIRAAAQSRRDVMSTSGVDISGIPNLPANPADFWEADDAALQP